MISRKKHVNGWGVLLRRGVPVLPLTERGVTESEYEFRLNRRARGTLNDNPMRDKNECMYRVGGRGDTWDDGFCPESLPGVEPERKSGVHFCFVQFKALLDTLACSASFYTSKVGIGKVFSSARWSCKVGRRKLRSPTARANWVRD